MNDRVKNVHEQVRTLSVEEQLALSDLLRAGALSEQDVEQAWRAEIEDRIAALERGEAKLIPAAEVLARIRQQ